MTWTEEDVKAAADEAAAGLRASMSGNGRAPDPNRYSGRRVDLDELLARPPKPVPWRIHGLVADATLTIVSGEAGSGKSWLVQAACIGVARGDITAGLLCVKGRALFVDGEMGPDMFVDQRLRPAGVETAEFDYIDAMGLDLSQPADLGWLRGEIGELAANLVVIDSLRRLAPSKSENDSDDMAPTVAAIAKLARDTSAAIILVHHKGDSDKYYRGSTSIRDQTDALFALLRVESGDDDEEEGDERVRRLTARGGRAKMRYAPEPDDVYLVISPEDGGVKDVLPPATGSRAPMRAMLMRGILAALPAKTKTEVAAVLRRPLGDRWFREAWTDLERDGAIAHVDGVWRVVVLPDPRETSTTTTHGEAP